MFDITYELNVIKNNRRGEEVRDAFIEAIKKIHESDLNVLVRLGDATVNDICTR